jgi:hypothetical protein
LGLTARLVAFGLIVPASKRSTARRLTMTNTHPLRREDLKQFYGTEKWYRHGLARDVLYTDGARHVAVHGGAFWLLDEIALAQKYQPKVMAEAFQVWKLTVNEDRSATLSCEDGNLVEVYRKTLDYTDFPLPDITLWFTDKVILLPSEY